MRMEKVNKVIVLFTSVLVLMVLVSVSVSFSGHLDRKYNPRLSLTPEEIAFLVEHPVIRVSNETDWPPFDYVEDGKPVGLSIEYLDALSQIIGVEFEYVNGYTWSELLQMGYDKKIDLLHSLVRTSERAENLLFTSPYIEMKNAYVTLRSSSRISSLEELSGKTLAYPKGYSEYEQIRTQFPQIRIVLVKDVEEGIAMVSQGKADAFLGSALVIMEAVEKQSLNNLQVVERKDLGNNEMERLRFAVRNDWGALRTILDKAMPLVPYETRLHLTEKWTHNVPIFYQMNSLTAEEKSWLSVHRSVKAAVVTDISPISYFDRQGKYSGIASEYMKAITEETGVTFDFILTEDVESAMSKLKSGEADVILPLAYSDQRSKRMLFTQGFYSLPIALYGNDSNPVVKSLEEVNGTRLAVVKGSVLEEWLLRDHANLDLESIESRTVALDRINSGENLIFAEEYLSGNLVLTQKGYTNVRIVGMTDYQYDMSIAVRRDWGTFRDILRKILPGIKSTKGEIFAQKWLLRGMTDRNDISRSIVLLIGGIAIAILSIIAVREQMMLRTIRKRFRGIDGNVAYAICRKDGTVEHMSEALRRSIVEKGLFAGKGLKAEYDGENDRGWIIVEDPDSASGVLKVECRMISHGHGEKDMLFLILL